MDISLNTGHLPVAPTESPREVSGAAAAGKSAGASRPTLTITEARVEAGSSVEAVPDEALRRDDELGRLFSAAFTLPPPPMPAFPAS